MTNTQRPPNCTDRTCGQCFRCHIQGIQFGQGAAPWKSKQPIRPIEQPKVGMAADERPGGYRVPILDSQGQRMRADDPRASNQSLSDLRKRISAEAAGGTG